MDCLINAATRPFNCYRKPIAAFYENDRLKTEGSCKTNSGEDCPRCTLHPSPICCSLCSPTHPVFDLLPPLGDSVDKPKVPRASQVDSHYKMNANDAELRAALHTLRREHTVRLYGLAHFHELGAGAVMSDDVLKRIVDCARVHKLRDCEALFRETKWHHTDDLGDAVLQLVHKFYPLPVPLAPSNPGQTNGAPPENEQESSSSAAAKRAPRRCSACGAFGHIKSNIACPNYTPRTPQAQRAGKENAMPSSGPSRSAPTETPSTSQPDSSTPARLTGIPIVLP
ncbi:hypothetical protein FKP32DRAFT_1679914 [Trametes sanguinea]|nr:hypothetical protein FKP32DRAFT_1679914 [Trametes sanguinea]